MTDLAVAYRIYPGISKTPAYFATDKFKLSQMCLASFRQALGGVNVKVYAILDDCPPEYEELFREVLKEFDLEVIKTQRIGNLATFSLQVDILTRQTESNFIYFAEDDYFYLPGAIEKMLSFMRDNPDADFVTPYDHPDSYYTSSRRERHLVKPWGDRYWRTASSTCLTFLASRKALVETATIFRTYSNGNMDCPIWLAVTEKFGLTNPRVHWCDMFRFKTWVKTWRWGWRSILFKRRFRLYAPLPTLATHMESSCLSPLVDWQREFQQFTKYAEYSKSTRWIENH
jgi:hypothetical protein